MLNQNGSIKRVLNLADARVDKAKGVVICSTHRRGTAALLHARRLPQGVLHTFDYPLYFFDVRANAADRVEHFFASHKEF